MWSLIKEIRQAQRVSNASMINIEAIARSSKKAYEEDRSPADSATSTISVIEASLSPQMLEKTEPDELQTNINRTRKYLTALKRENSQLRRDNDHYQSMAKEMQERYERLLSDMSELAMSDINEKRESGFSEGQEEDDEHHEKVEYTEDESYGEELHDEEFREKDVHEEESWDDPPEYVKVKIEELERMMERLDEGLE